MAHAPIAVTVLTGFLGAGKTTLLNRLLKEPDLHDTAVIVNEFGDVGIDHLLVEQSNDGVIELSDGCLCCTVRGDLVDTLADLVDRVQTRRAAPLRRVVIETTGLADPVPVLQALMGHPVLVQAYRLDGVVCVVDAVNGAATLDAHEEAVRQVAVADRLAISKTDLADPAGRDALTHRLAALNPNAPLIELSAERAAASSLLDCGLYDPAARVPDVARWLGAAAHDDHHHHHHGHTHHHHHRHDDRVKSFTLVHDGAIPFAAIETFLDLLRSTQGEHLLRMKGIVETAEDRERPLVIHGVQKLLHPPVRLPGWPEGPRGVRLVLIAMDMDADYVARLFSAVTGRPAPDTPDRAALADNPLAIAGFTPR